MVTFALPSPNPATKTTHTSGWVSDLPHQPPPPAAEREKGAALRKTSIKGGWRVLNFKMLSYGEKYFGKETIFEIVLHSKVNGAHMSSTKT